MSDVPSAAEDVVDDDEDNGRGGRKTRGLGIESCSVPLAGNADTQHLITC